jgi:hypothetical protein
MEPAGPHQKTKALTYAVWGDINFVKTLSNFHSPVTLKGGMKRKRGIHKPRRGRGILVKSIVLFNKRHTVIPIIIFIKEMELKPNMICRLNLVCMDGDPS